MTQERADLSLLLMRTKEKGSLGPGCVGNPDDFLPICGKLNVI